MWESYFVLLQSRKIVYVVVILHINSERQLRKMLIDDIVDFCDKKYTTYGEKCGCERCNHPSGHCSGNCYNCLYHIHFPERAPLNSKALYDCPKMLYHYICQYSYLYTTELLCAYEEEHDYLNNYPYFHILSLGCGGCADLMAFEYFYHMHSLEAPISYIGIDVNELWRPINNRTLKYCENNGINYKVRYADVFKCFRQHIVNDTNVIVISYLISYLYNTDQITVIDSFLEDLVRNIVQKKNKGQKLLLIINDVNSYKRGRTYFSQFRQKLEKYKLSIIKCTYKYFDTGDLFDGQKIGTPHSVKGCLFSIPEAIQRTYHAESNCKKTIQLMLEVV